MSNIEKIRQEIERRKGLIEGLFIEGDNNFYDGQDDAYNHLLAFIDSLPEDASCVYDTNKLTPTPSVNIEDVARVQFASHAHVFDRKRKAVFDWQQFKEVAGIFYGFGKRDSLPDEKPSYVTDSPGDPGNPGEPGISDLEEEAEEWAENEAYGKSDAEFEMAYKGFIAGAEWQRGQAK